MSKPHYGVLLLSFSRHSHQRSFVPLYRRHPRIHLVAVTDEPDIDPELEALDRKWAAELGIPYLQGVDQALQREDVDVVSIGHEIERRAVLARRAAAAGKHLWIDKFIGATVEEADSVVAAVAAAGVKSIVPSFTYSTLVQESQAVLARGELGRLLGVHVDALFSKGWPRPIADHLRATPFLLPGRWKFFELKRELLTVGAYAVALVQRCLGRVVQVYGQGGARFFPEHAARGTEDFGALTLVDETGRVATLCGGRIGVATHPYGGPLRAYLVGSRASAVVDGKRPALDVFLRPDITGSRHQPSPADPMQWASGPPALGVPLAEDPTGLAAALDDLVAALDEDRQPLYTVRDNRDLMEILIAGYLSIGERASIDLPLPRGNG